MRIRTGLAWTILLLSFFTAGLLRQFHDQTPASPLLPPIVGSLLFAAIFLLLLVTARERRRGTAAGPGVTLGCLTPILLMLLVEKWVSITLYGWVFMRLARPESASPTLDAQFRALAGVGLILVCLLISLFSEPTSRKAWRRARPSRWPVAALGVGAVLIACYGVLALLSWSLGGDIALRLPPGRAALGWILGGQALLAFAEELYYRGLLMSEIEHLAPRLGLGAPAARRWVALGLTASLFGMEHLTLGPPWGQAMRELVFTVCLGVLLGMLVMMSANLHFAAGVHAWINWLLLGAAPHFVYSDGTKALPAGTYIGLTLILAFGMTILTQRWRGRPRSREPAQFANP